MNRFKKWNFSVTPFVLIFLVCCAFAMSDSSAAREKGLTFESSEQTATPTPTPPVTNGGLPVVSSDGLKIAFVSNRTGNDDVYVINSDGTNEVQLTKTPEEEGNIQWNVDGQQVVFSRFADGTSSVYSIGLDGRNEREIAKIPGRGPTLSPNGKQIVYMAGGSWTVTKLMVAASDGSKARQINDGNSIAWNNHWSPDGSLIAFTGRKDTANPLAIFVINSDGTNLRQVSHLAAEEGSAQWPVWSPDGRRLAIQVNKSKEKIAHIWTVDVATGAATRLASHTEKYLDETPSWFPDGKRIAFQSNRTGSVEVWVMNADGTGQRQVTKTR